MFFWHLVLEKSEFQKGSRLYNSLWIELGFWVGTGYFWLFIIVASQRSKYARTPRPPEAGRTTARIHSCLARGPPPPLTPAGREGEPQRHGEKSAQFSCHKHLGGERSEGAKPPLIHANGFSRIRISSRSCFLSRFRKLTASRNRTEGAGS